MSRRVNESARVLGFFKQAELGKAEVLYDLVRKVMQERLAPKKAAQKAQAKKRAPKLMKETNPAADAYVQPV